MEFIKQVRFIEFCITLHENLYELKLTTNSKCQN